MSYKIGVEIDGQQCITFFDPIEQTEASICLSTITDYQTRAILKIFLCDTKNALLIDEIPVNDIPPEKAGEPKIDLAVSLTNHYKFALTVALNDQPSETLDYNLKPYLKVLAEQPGSWSGQQQQTHLRTENKTEQRDHPPPEISGKSRGGQPASYGQAGGISEPHSSGGDNPVKTADEFQDRKQSKTVYVMAGVGIIILGILVFFINRFMNSETGDTNFSYPTNVSDLQDRSEPVNTTNSNISGSTGSRTTEPAGEEQKPDNGYLTAGFSTNQPAEGLTNPILPDVTVTLIQYSEVPTATPRQNSSTAAPTTRDNPITKTTVYFLPESFELIPNTCIDLDRLATSLNKYSIIRLEGHCALFDSEAERYELSIQRVKAVYDYLLKKGWNPVTEPKLIGYGGKLPVTQDKANQHLNRRVEIISDK